ncbi:hypothetical protein O5O51_03325 [Sinirhodobacter sp. HNIBRBA609]|nr:hypothetical protein O5O51_03325 [Sinirhodobacter sp. HNIBRBA609]
MMEHMLCALFYLLSGGLLWREIVVPGPRDPHDNLERIQIAVWQNEKTPGFLLAKATFILAWPLVIAYAYLVGRVLD